MNARIIIPKASGERLCYDLRLRHAGVGGSTVRIVFHTAEEPFDRWLFYLLRDLGAHVVADDPAELRKALGLAANEPGVVSQAEVAEVPVA